MSLTNIVAIFIAFFFFGGSIFIHELGHFLAAKACGLWVPKFSIGFGPKLFSFRWKGTDFQISAFPFGGYVAIPQLVKIELLEGTHGRLPEGQGPSVSLPVRILVSLMGVIFNLLFAFFLAGLLFIFGRPVKLSQQTRIIGAIPDMVTVGDRSFKNPILSVNLLPGDEILSVDSRAIENFLDLANRVALGVKRNGQSEPISQFRVRRDDQIFDVSVPAIYVGEKTPCHSPLRAVMILPQDSLVIAGILADSAAERSGLMVGDEILKINGQKIYSPQMVSQCAGRGQGPLRLEILRGGAILTIDIRPEQRLFRESFFEGKFNKRPVYFQTVDDHVTNFYGPTRLRNCSKEKLMAALTDLRFHEEELRAYLGIQFSSPETMIHENPFRQLERALNSTVQTVGSLFNFQSDIGIKSLTGVPGIVRILHHFSLTDFRRLFWFVMVLNVGLAVLNLLPLPGLDGGQILFAFLERRISRDSVLKFLALTQNLVLLLLFILMVYIALLDLLRWRNDRTLQNEQRIIQSFCHFSRL